MTAYFLFFALILTFLTLHAVEGVNICTDTGCFCDDIKPYLISCKELNLNTLFTPDDWLETIEKQNISDFDLDVRFDSNSLKNITSFPNIRIVNLSFQNNRLNSIEKYAFRELNYLRSLDLSRNEFTAKDLPEYVFLGYYNETSFDPLPLLSLNLSNNAIHT